jgi:hypothetical protein
VPEFIDPVFAKTSPKRSFLVIENERFRLVFAKTGSINSGTGPRRGRDQLVFMAKTKSINGGYVGNIFIVLFSPETTLQKYSAVAILLPVGCIDEFKRPLLREVQPSILKRVS